MFNLDHAIADWRRRALREGLAPDVIDELESHLRDEVARQMSDGADDETAFVQAVQLLGDTAQLKEEFANAGEPKVINPPQRSPRAKKFSFLGALAIVVINTWTLVDFGLSALETMIGAYAVAATGLFVACAPYLREWLSMPAYARTMQVMKVAANLAALAPIILILSAMHVIQLDNRPLATLLLWLFLAGVTFSLLAIALCNDPNSGSSGGSDSGGTLHPNPPPRTTGPFAKFREATLALPPSDKLAVDSRELLTAAREEAARLGHDFIGTEHVLLGLLKVAKGALATLLTGRNIAFESVRQDVERLVGPQKAELPSAQIPFTPRARKALQIAGKEALRLHQPLVTADHVLLGLILEGSGLGARILKKMGIRSEPIRKLLASDRSHFSIE
jgi:hypothetical protein